MNAITAKDATDGLGLVVNGERVAFRVRTLAELLDAAGYADQKVATALNGSFVPERQRAKTGLKAGDSIEILSPRQGG